MAYEGIVYQLTPGVMKESLQKLYGDTVPKDAVAATMLAAVAVVEAEMKNMELRFSSDVSENNKFMADYLESIYAPKIHPVIESELGEIRSGIEANARECSIDEMEKVLEAECDQLMQFMDFLYAPPSANTINEPWFTAYYEKYKDMMDPKGVIMNLAKMLTQ